MDTIERIEFVITYACTGRCRHCSQGEHSNRGKVIDADAAAETVRNVTGKHKIRSLMTFGGEALLYPEAVYRIHSVARKLRIGKRQLITNGFFSRDKGYIKQVAYRLFECGINDLLLSVDAFHDECIPLEYVRLFADECLKNSIPIRLNPAWLGSYDNHNSYNTRTRQIIAEFKEMGIAEGGGNIVFPKGNALKYFPEYFDGKSYDPYEDNRTVCFDPDSDLKGVFYQ
ncbi:MAG: radical SAM protein [Clostridia bacterium]|nr:radical SAM protein [Clostridia bacterium]